MSYRTLRRALRLAAIALAATPVGLAATTSQPTTIAPTAVLIGPACATVDPTAFPCPALPCGDPMLPDYDYCIDPKFKG
ncbi:MAG: hypothetical protein ACH36H_11480 [Candidatus Nanopelagicales bacterium]